MIQSFKQKGDFDILRKEMDAALQTVADKLGLASLKTGRISYTEFACTVKVEAKTVSSEKSIEAEQKLSQQCSEVLGFNKNIVGEVFSANGKDFTVTRIDLKKRLYPVIASGPDGKSYKFKEDKLRFKNKEIVNTIYQHLKSEL